MVLLLKISFCYIVSKQYNNRSHIQGFWLSKFQLQKYEYHIQNQHKKLHGTIYLTLKVIFALNFSSTTSYSEVWVFLSLYGLFFMQKYVHHILKTTFLDVTHSALSNHTEKTPKKDISPNLEV